MLFEGRRIRKASSGFDILVTGGYLRFTATVESVVAEILTGTPVGSKVSPSAMSSALIGMFESMLRDQVLARRMNQQPTCTFEEVREIFDLFLRRVLGSEQPSS
jgi:hypothetical protein